MVCSGLRTAELPPLTSSLIPSTFIQRLSEVWAMNSRELFPGLVVGCVSHAQATFGLVRHGVSADVAPFGACVCQYSFAKLDQNHPLAAPLGIFCCHLWQLLGSSRLANEDLERCSERNSPAGAPSALNPAWEIMWTTSAMQRAHPGLAAAAASRRQTHAELSCTAQCPS